MRTWIGVFVFTVIHVGFVGELALGKVVVIQGHAKPSLEPAAHYADLRARSLGEAALAGLGVVFR